MKIHHLNCASLHVPGNPLVCHVLLLETNAGLVLVDSGFGLHDIADPRRRLGVARRLIRPALDPAETAVRQIQALGYTRDDVRHIVITHFDFDHIGGISDFPNAFIHVTAAEALGSMWSPTRREKLRYRSAQWAHRPAIVEHSPQGEAWRGFAAAKSLEEIDPDIVLVSMPGHSRGHAAVAVNAGDRWLLHAGDAFYHRGEIDGSTAVPRLLSASEKLVAFDRQQVIANQQRLAELHRYGDPTLTILCAHDPQMLAAAREMNHLGSSR